NLIDVDEYAADLSCFATVGASLDPVGEDVTGVENFCATGESVTIFPRAIDHRNHHGGAFLNVARGGAAGRFMQCQSLVVVHPDRAFRPDVGDAVGAGGGNECQLLPEDFGHMVGDFYAHHHSLRLSVHG